MLDVALTSIEIDGPTAITARRVAASAGSSTAAVYELFGDKGGLVRSMFFAGFTALADRLESLPPHPDHRTSVRAGLDVARDFAVASPGLFEVMYQRPFVEFTPDASDLAVGRSVYDHFVERVANWLDSSPRSEWIVDATQALVATNRGLVANEIAGVLGSTPATVERRRDVALDAVFDGLAHAHRGSAV